ncbi:MAG: hypothetical protein WCG80_16805 [Spirochaetales bacterium]
MAIIIDFGEVVLLEKSVTVVRDTNQIWGQFVYRPKYGTVANKEAIDLCIDCNYNIDGKAFPAVWTSLKDSTRDERVALFFAEIVKLHDWLETDEHGQIAVYRAEGMTFFGASDNIIALWRNSPLIGGNTPTLVDSIASS